MDNVPNKYHPPPRQGNPFKRKFRFCQELIPQLNYNYYNSPRYYPWYPQQRNTARNNRDRSSTTRNNTGKHLKNVFKKVNKRAAFTRQQKTTKQPSRPSSPLLGTEEYRLRKIQQTSELIKRQLLSGDIDASNTDDNQEMGEPTSKIGAPRRNNYCQEAVPNIVTEKLSSKQMLSDKVQDDKISSKKGTPKKANQTSYNIEEIHDKIVGHISKLNYGRKVNLINSASSGYDLAIQQIQKQKRLELSRALRAMCTTESVECAEVVNSLIPDIGIKLEDLPREVIEQLSITLNSVGDEQLVFGELLGFGDGATSVEQIQENLHEESVGSNGSEVKMNLADYDLPSEIQCTQEDKNDLCEIQSELAHNEISSEIPSLQEDDLCSDIICEPKAVISDSLVDFCPFDNDNFKTDIEDKTKEDCILIEPKVETIDIEEDNKQLLALLEVKEEPELSEDEINVQEPIAEENIQEPIAEVITKVNMREPVSLPPPVPVVFINRGIQKNFECNRYCTKYTQTSYNKRPKDLNEAIAIMLEIDLEIERLTKIRKEVFLNLSKHTSHNKYSNRQYEYPSSRTRLRSRVSGELDSIRNTDLPEGPKERRLWSSKVLNKMSQSAQRSLIGTQILENNKNTNKRKERVNQDSSDQNTQIDEDNRIVKRRKGDVDDGDDDDDDDDDVQIVSPTGTSTGMYPFKRRARLPLMKLKVAKRRHTSTKFDLNELTEKVLVLNLFGKRLVAGTENGNVLIFSATLGILLNTIHVTTSPITCFALNKDKEMQDLYVGSFDQKLVVYDFNTYKFGSMISVDSSIQCMEKKWGFLFLGCVNGYLRRYSMKHSRIEFEDFISATSILVLVATMEGARKVLLIGTRNSPICVRDAMSGLRMRTLDDAISPTVYSLALKNGTVYCGTPTNDILAFSFYDGKLQEKMSVTNSKGVSCLKIANDLLYASCHDGNIYVFNTKPRKFIGKIKGPGGVILSMELIRDKIVIGTMSSKFTAVSIPRTILKMRRFGSSST